MLPGRPRPSPYFPSNYTVARDSSGHVEVRFVSKPGGPNITVIWDDSFLKSWRSLAIGSSVWGIEHEESHLTMTLAFGGLYAPVCVAECTYAGYEYLTKFSLDSADNYIQAGLV